MRKAVFLTILCLTLAGAGLPSAARAEGGLNVFTGIEPAAYFVQRVAGDRARVTALLKGHQDPHTFEPTPRLMADLAGAKAFFLVGLPFERQLAGKLGHGAGAPLVVDLGQGVPRRRMEAHGQHHEDEGHHEHGEHSHEHEAGHHAEKPGHHEAGEHEHAHEHGEWDPHIWLSPRLGALIAANAAKALAELDPAGRESFEKNLAALRAELEQADREIAGLLAPFRGAAVMVYHPAFGYFLDQYGLKQLAVQTEGKEPGAKELAGLIALARREKVKVIFLQKSQASAGARQVARAVGASLAEMDPLAPDYLANLQRMSKALSEALKR